MTQPPGGGRRLPSTGPRPSFRKCPQRCGPLPPPSPLPHSCPSPSRQHRAHSSPQVQAGGDRIFDRCMEKVPPGNGEEATELPNGSGKHGGRFLRGGDIWALRGQQAFGRGSAEGWAQRAQARQGERAASEAPACGQGMRKMRLESTRWPGFPKPRWSACCLPMGMRARTDVHREAGSVGHEFHTLWKCMGPSGTAAATDRFTPGDRAVYIPTPRGRVGVESPVWAWGGADRKWPPLSSRRRRSPPPPE